MKTFAEGYNNLPKSKDKWRNFKVKEQNRTFLLLSVSLYWMLLSRKHWMTKIRPALVFEANNFEQTCKLESSFKLQLKIFVVRCRKTGHTRYVQQFSMLRGFHLALDGLFPSLSFRERDLRRTQLKNSNFKVAVILRGNHENQERGHPRFFSSSHSFNTRIWMITGWSQ